jgi:hypothetical protein
VTLSPEDRDALSRATTLLEQPGLATRLTGLIGMPVEKALDLLPAQWSKAVAEATEKSLEAALKAAVMTLGDRPHGASSDFLHKVAVATTGAGGGVFGLVGLPLELPVSTTLMLRSIADIAQSEGETLDSLEARMACIEVFALGGRTSADRASESAYFLVRASLARAVADAAKFIAEKGVVQEGAPVLVRLIAQVAARFGVVVSEKVAAQAVPLLGAAGGGAINLLFMNHFQQVARGHFIVRRLERAYSPEFIRAEYDRLRQDQRPSAT